MSGHRVTPSWVAFVASRWKAIAALLVPLLGGLAALAPNSNDAKVIGIVITALVAGGVVHQVPNVVAQPVADVTGAFGGLVGTVLPDDAKGEQ